LASTPTTIGKCCAIGVSIHGVVVRHWEHCTGGGQRVGVIGAFFAEKNKYQFLTFNLKKIAVLMCPLQMEDLE